MSKQHLNVALKTAIFASGKKQKRIAKLARMSEAQLSHVIRGRRDADDDERSRIAKAVGRPVDELFPEQVGV